MYMDAVMKEVERVIGRMGGEGHLWGRGESGDYLSFWMQMARFCVVMT